MSVSNKQNTNKESVSYLVLYALQSKSNTDIENLDYDSYLITEANNPKEILEYVKNNWNEDIEPEHLYILPFKKSQIKRIKQTLELV